MTRQSPPTPYELLHRIAERRGAKVRLYSDVVRYVRDSELRVLSVHGKELDEDVPLATASLEGKTLDEEALSCLRQMKERV